jgi:predicted dehydrogenase
MTNQVSVALAGIGGYGDAYLEALMHDRRSANLRLVGVVDPYPERCRHLKDLRDRKIPIHSELESLLKQADRKLDLLMIVTPIHLHAPQTCLALQHGINVLCEKPLAGTLPDALRMAECEQAGSNFVAIGYQWSFSHAVQALKRDIMEGLFGAAVRMKSIGLFPRPLEYFRRNDWVGRIQMPAGDGVLDSPANNATAHYLHNMLYLLGRSRETSATPVTVQAELYRANAIENYDTAAIRAVTDQGVEVLFYTSHTVREPLGVLCHFEFENATIEYDAAGAAEFIAHFRDGRTRSYGAPNIDRHLKIWQCADACRGGTPIACGIRAALPHTLCIVAAQESAATIATFPQAMHRQHEDNGDSMVYIEGLSSALREAYLHGALPAELPQNVSWAKPGAPIHMSASRLAAAASRLSATVATPRVTTYATGGARSSTAPAAS